MSHAEIFTLESLTEFVENVEEYGLSYNGRDIDSNLQALVIEIVRDYMESIDNGE